MVGKLFLSQNWLIYEQSAGELLHCVDSGFRLFFMTTTNSKWAIEGQVNGEWSREHVGAADETTLFDLRDDAAAAIPVLAEHLGCDEREMRVVEIGGAS